MQKVAIFIDFNCMYFIYYKKVILIFKWNVFISRKMSNNAYIKTFLWLVRQWLIVTESKKMCQGCLTELFSSDISFIFATWKLKLHCACWHLSFSFFSFFSLTFFFLVLLAGTFISYRYLQSSLQEKQSFRP